jgi:hypothetical protein
MWGLATRRRASHSHEKKIQATGSRSGVPEAWMWFFFKKLSVDTSRVLLCCVVRPREREHWKTRNSSRWLISWIRVNDPSAGSPTETLLRLLLPLNDQV